MIRVLVVDDNIMMQRGLSETISVEPDMEVVGAAGDTEAAISLYKELKPDVVLMDYQMPGENGIICTQKILEIDPDAKVLMLSMFDSEEDIFTAVKAGVKGYLTKKAGDVDILIDAILEIADNENYFPTPIAQKLERRQSAKTLSKREHEILQYLANGHNNQEIAVITGLSLATVKFHVIHIRQKLNAADRTEAVANGFRRGLLRIDEEPI